MVDVAQQNLKEPAKVDWDAIGSSGGKYQAPPPALDAAGKPIVYYGKLKEAKQADPDQEHLNYQLDLVLEKSGPYDGRQIRTWASTRPFMKRNQETGELEPIKGNPNSLAKFVKAAGVQAKPQTNSEYQATVKAVNGKLIPFTIDWEAKKDGEVIRGYRCFPEDPANPGSRKSILRQGDTYSVYDRKGNFIETKTVQSEILFANARIQYFQDSTKK